MAEREHQPQKFDRQAVAQALDAASSPLVDPAFGDGWHFQLNGDRPPLSLDTFPGSGVSRITTRGARIELFGSTLPTVEDEGIVFLQKDSEHEHTTVALHPDGALTLGYQVDTGPAPVAGLPETEDTEQLLEANEAEPAADVAPAAKPPEKSQGLNRLPGAFPDTRPMIQRTSAAEPVREPTETPQPEKPQDEAPIARAARIRAEDAKQRQGGAENTKTEAAEPETADAKEEAERVKLTGRIGRAPTFRTTAAGKLVGKFPLAVHLEDGTTTWRDVLAFGDRAAALQKRIEDGQLGKGHEVDVTGYTHEREYKGRDGTPKTAQEIYSVAVIRR